MIRHIWSVLCAKTSIDRGTNNISLFEVIEASQITTPGNLTFPTNVPFDGVFVTLWGRRQFNTPGIAEMRVRFLGPNNEELSTFGAPINLENNPRSRHMAQLIGLRCGGNGLHEFEVSWRQDQDDAWHVVASVPVDLTFQVDPAIAQ
jgi:hypothetical protein